MTPAFRGAARYGDVERLRALLDSGSDVNARDRYHQTGLMLAALRFQHAKEMQRVRLIWSYR